MTNKVWQWINRKNHTWIIHFSEIFEKTDPEAALATATGIFHREEVAIEQWRNIATMLTFIFIQQSQGVQQQYLLSININCYFQPGTFLPANCYWSNITVLVAYNINTKINFLPAAPAFHVSCTNNRSHIFCYRNLFGRNIYTYWPTNIICFITFTGPCFYFL